MKRIFFGIQNDWEENIRSQLDATRYECDFGDFLKGSFEGYDAIVPLTLEDYWGLNERGDELRGRAIFPPNSLVQLCHAKSRFNEYVLSTDFASLIPSTSVPPGAYPYILKKIEDEYGSSSYLIRDPDDEAAHRSEVDSAEYFKQSYVPGRFEHTTHMLMCDGDLKYSLNVSYDMGKDYYVKSSKDRQVADSIDAHSPHIEAFKAVLGSLGYADGTCCFNYKERDGVPLIFEVNPRFGGSLFRDINAYLDAYLDATSRRPARPGS